MIHVKARPNFVSSFGRSFRKSSQQIKCPKSRSSPNYPPSLTSQQLGSVPNWEVWSKACQIVPGHRLDQSVDPMDIPIGHPVPPPGLWGHFSPGRQLYHVWTKPTSLDRKTEPCNMWIASLCHQTPRIFAL